MFPLCSTAKCTRRTYHWLMAVREHRFGAYGPTRKLLCLLGGGGGRTRART